MPRTQGVNASTRGCRLHVGRGANVVDLEDHLDELCRELDLAALAVKGLDDALLLHVARPRQLHAVHAQRRVLLRHLSKNPTIISS